MDTNNGLYVLDSYGLIYRAYFAFINRPLTNEKKENVSAVFGFFRNFYNILKEYNPQYVVAAFDSKTPTFRHEIYDQYKANRAKTPEDLHLQIPVIEEILMALGIPVIRSDGYEADDIIATLAQHCCKENRPCYILSGDKDLMQLVNCTTSILKPNKTGGWDTVDSEGVKAEWGVGPELMLDLLSLIGDTSDNVPGVKGIGEKTAQKLLAEYGTLDGIYAKADEIKGAVGDKIRSGKEMAYFSKILIALKYDVPCKSDIEQYKIPQFHFEKAAELLYKVGVPSVAKQYASKSESPVSLSASSEKSEQNNTTSTSSSSNGKISGKNNLYIEEDSYQEVRENIGDYKTIRNLVELERILDNAIKVGSVAFDTETDSLNSMKARLAGFSLCYEAGKAYYIPVETNDPLLSGEMIPKEKALTALEKIFMNPEMQIIMHNGKYDLEVLATNGMKSPLQATIIDTMLAAWLLQSDRTSFKLEALAETKLGLRGIEFETIVPKGTTFMDLPVETATPYGAEDADFTWQLWEYYKEKIEKAGFTSLFYDLETPVLRILTEMEIEGIHLDSSQLETFSVELEKNIKNIEKAIYEIVGYEFNIASTKQLQEVLFEKRGLIPLKKTKTGYSTDTAVLEDLAAQDPVPRKILEYRTLTKLKSTYVDTLPLLVDENQRIHTSFIQTGTATGRLSSKEPNLQNLPVRDEEGRRIRTAFTASKGKTLVSADYSQIELVVLAHLSEDPALCNAFIQGIDVHKATASLIFNVETDKVTPEQRRTAKTINFGVMYGMSAFRLSKELGIPMGTAKSFIDSYFATYQGITRFISETVSQCEEKGYVETILGRRRTIEAINNSNKTIKAGAERMAVNTPIQGSAADIVKMAMIAVHKALKEKFPSAKLLLQVHDELIVECDESQGEQVAQLMKEEMEGIMSLKVPLRVSVEYGKSWGEFH